MEWTKNSGDINKTLNMMLFCYVPDPLVVSRPKKTYMLKFFTK